MKPTINALLGALLVTGGIACGGKSDSAGAAVAQAPASASGVTDKNGNKNACRLLKAEEVEALLEQKVTMASVEESMPAYSKCQWEDEHNVALFMIEVWWAGGKQQWQIWNQANKTGSAMLQKAEGAMPMDSIVPQGPVPGIGDGAIFSEIMPSRVIQGDRYVEMNLVMVPHAASKFRKLATTLLERM